MTADTKDKVKELRKDISNLRDELKALAFVTEDETGYVAYELQDCPETEDDFEKWEKKYQDIQEGNQHARVTISISAIGSICGSSVVDMSGKDIDKMLDNRYKASNISRKISTVRRSLTKERKIEQKERELNALKNRSNGFSAQYNEDPLGWILQCDDEFY